MKKIIVLLIFVFIICLFAIFNFSIFGYRVYRIATGSMKPYLNINDVVIVKKYNQYKVGDVITYKDDNHFITHRIVKINKSKIITKGDSNNIEDIEIDKEKVVGKVIYKFIIINHLIKIPSILIIVIGFVITLLLPGKVKVKYEKKS